MTVVLDLDGVLTEHPRVLASAASAQFGIDLPERAFIDAAGLEISDEIRGWVYGVDGPAARLAPATDAAALVARLAAVTAVCIVTARSAACAPMTRAWLARHGFPDVPMRFADDKPAVARDLRAVCAIEDSERHARVYSATGIPCLLIGDGDPIEGVTRVATLAEAVAAAEALAPPPAGDADDAGAAATTAAGHLLEALAPGFVALRVTVNGLVPADEIEEDTVALMLAGALAERSGSEVGPDDARRRAAELGIRLTIHAGTDDPEVEQSFSFDATGEDPHHVRVAGTGADAGIVEVDRYALDGALHGDLLITRHTDAPGVIGKVGTVLGRHEVNIAGMQVGRHHRGGEALMVLNVDEAIPPAAEAEIRAISGLTAVYVVSLPAVAAAVPVSEPVALKSRRGRWVLAVTVLGTGIALLEATIVNVALTTLGRDLDAGVDDIQWVVNAYMLTLASLILFGGALGDRIGRRRVFVIGIVWFTVASALCTVAPSVGVLIAARALQGVGGALLTPGSLAIIGAAFVPQDRARAIGAWSGLVSIAAAIGPLVGGWLVDVSSWRAIFLINVPIGAVVVFLALRHVPESRDAESAGPLDSAGAALATVALGGITVALIQAPAGTSPALVVAAAVVGIVAAIAFVLVERRSPRPMLPLELFGSRRFSGANGITFVVWGPISAIFLFLVVYLQVSLDYSPPASGAALLPITAVMLTLSARVGALAQRIGARPFLTFGPLLLAAGVLAIRSIDPGDAYWTGILPPLLLFAFGLVSLVAPVTAVALQGAGTRHAGIASGVNNAVARTAQLLAIAVLPSLAGLSGDAYTDPVAVAEAFRIAMTICAGVAAVGAVIGYVTIRDPAPPA